MLKNFENERSEKILDEKLALSNLVTKLQETIKDIELNSLNEKEVLKQENKFLRDCWKRREDRLMLEISIVEKERDKLILKLSSVDFSDPE